MITDCIFNANEFKIKYIKKSDKNLFTCIIIYHTKLNKRNYLLLGDSSVMKIIRIAKKWQKIFFSCKIVSNS